MVAEVPCSGAPCRESSGPTPCPIPVNSLPIWFPLPRDAHFATASATHVRGKQKPCGKVRGHPKPCGLRTFATGCALRHRRVPPMFGVSKNPVARFWVTQNPVADEVASIPGSFNSGHRGGIHPWSPSLVQKVVFSASVSRSPSPSIKCPLLWLVPGVPSRHLPARFGVSRNLAEDNNTNKVVDIIWWC